MINTPLTLWLIMIALSVLTYFCLAPRQKHLPMQWTFTGKVLWRSPRLQALFFMPLLIAAISLFICTMPDYMSNPMEPLTMVNAIGFGIHVIHIGLLWLTLG